MTLAGSREPTAPSAGKLEFTAAEIGALAHLYRGEVYRSTVWRTRLDSSTNWAVVTTGIALSATYSSAEASPLPLVLVGLLVAVFLLFEARRYRYFNVWRARARHQRRRRAPESRLDRIAGQRLSRSALSHQLRAGDRPAASAHIRLDFRDPGHCLLRQACDPPNSAHRSRGPLGTGSHWSDLWQPGYHGWHPVPCKLGGVRACHLSHRNYFATRAPQPDRDGIANSELRRGRTRLCSLRALVARLLAWERAVALRDGG
jgi:Predicted integral membrane protein (DUF2270)